MTTQTIQDTSTGYALVIGATLILLGSLAVIWFRSERAEKRELARENRELRQANARLTNHPSTRNSMDEHWSAFVEHTDQALRLAAAAPLADVVDLRGGRK